MVRGTPGVVMLAAAEELRVHGHREDSIQMAERAADWYRSRTGDEAKRETNRECFGESLYRAERWNEARPVFKSLAAGKPADVAYKGWLGAIAARNGDRATAERISDELSRVDPKFLFGIDALWRAQIAAVLGDKDGAVALLKESIARGTGISKARREQYGYGFLYPHLMDLESLRGYAPFEELVKPKG
jgi:predicted Zn-dependent protease